MAFEVLRLYAGVITLHLDPIELRISVEIGLDFECYVG